jgi:hypothetical protein
MGISVVQTKTATTNAAFSVTVTLTPTGAGNCLVVCAGDYLPAPALHGITLGGLAGNFARATGTTSGDAGGEIWVDPNCAGGQTVLVVTCGAGWPGGIGVVVYEVSGLVTSGAVDKVSDATGTSTGITSGATATTTAIAGLWVGMGFIFGENITGPPSPWTNTTLSGYDSYGDSLVAGYQVVSSAGTATYASTGAGSAQWVGAVVTLRGLPAPPVARRNPLPMQAVARAAYY